MKVLALASYPIEAAATRYRLHQFAKPLAERGISLTIKPFLNSAQFISLYNKKKLPLTALGILKAGAMRVKDVAAARDADVVLIQREAMMIGPPFIEWLTTKLANCPMVLDLDDATYVPYVSPTYGRLVKTLKWFTKTDDLISWAKVVTCGNQAIADYVESKGARAMVIPTVVDTQEFRPTHAVKRERVVLGWIGTHSTFPYLKTIFPVLKELARTYRFTLKIVGAGLNNIDLPGVEVENLEWKLDREIEDFQSIDIGRYPVDPSMSDKKWASGKSGFKAIQYMAVGVPYVASPVGAIADIGAAGTTYLSATTNDEWYEAIKLLLADPELRATMGAAGRSHVVRQYPLSEQVEKLASALHEAANT